MAGLCDLRGLTAADRSCRCRSALQPVRLLAGSLCLGLRVRCVPGAWAALCASRPFDPSTGGFRASPVLASCGPDLWSSWPWFLVGPLAGVWRRRCRACGRSLPCSVSWPLCELLMSVRPFNRWGGAAGRQTGCWRRSARLGGPIGPVRFPPGLSLSVVPSQRQDHLRCGCEQSAQSGGVSTATARKPPGPPSAGPRQRREAGRALLQALRSRPRTMPGTIGY